MTAMNPMESWRGNSLPAKSEERQELNDNQNYEADVMAFFTQARESLAQEKAGQADLFRTMGYDRFLELKKKGVFTEPALKRLQGEAEELYEELS